MLTDWVWKSSKYEMDESIDEMKHADELIARILFLKGLPNLQDLGHLKIGENIVELLEGDLSLEMDALVDLREGITLCDEHKDFVTKNLLEGILRSEEEHVDWLETQLGLIERTWGKITFNPKWQPSSSEQLIQVSLVVRIRNISVRG